MSLTSKKIAILLWILLTLFVGRVAAQLWVYLDSPDFLPPMEDWYSGLMPYRFLLPSQILIIALMIKIALDITKGEGFFGVPKLQMGVWLRNVGIIYFAGMIVRFLLQGISIMVVFHWILATFVILVGIFHLHSRKIP